MQKLKSNKLKCLECETILSSEHRWDFNQCRCPNGAFTDGGLDYQRYGAQDMSKVEVLSEYDEE